MSAHDMHDFDDIYDDYEHDYAEYERHLKHTDRRARRKRNPRPNHTPKVSHQDMLEDMADLTALEAGLDITYQPTQHEEKWLAESLRAFFQQDYIRDVLAMVKGGKEASVYRCTPAPHIERPFLAAKVYRPRMFRNLRNDKAYREGRSLLKQTGNAVKENEQRIMRALDKKSRFGEQVSHTSWLMYEYTTMQALHAAGAAVPRVYAHDLNAILMDYIGDENLAAPTLNGIALEPDEAQRLFDEVLRNIGLFLQHGKVHGDLSAYNILYWEGEITIIDFPQVIDAAVNTQADHIFKRDVQRVCDYFTRQGVECDALEIAADLWDTHVGFAPNERLLFMADEDDD